MNKDIDYASVETTRPPIYTAMKYWGKKPHNIWAEYIKHYTPDNGVYLDPFCGSGVSAIESLRLNKKTIAFDLNPMSSFLLEVLTSSYNQNSFSNIVQTIVKSIEGDLIYKKLYNYNNEFIHHIKTLNNEIYEVGIIIFDEKNNEEVCKKLRKPNKFDSDAINYAEKLDFQNFDFYYPNEEFYVSDSFNTSFISNIGGNNFKNIWTKRNLYVLSKIFAEIKQVANEELKKQLLFGFIQTVHLCTKMSVPREATANRPFSTSWGRAAYLCAAKQMEQNPLYVFKGSCFGKQSVDSSLTSARKYIPNEIKKRMVNLSNKQKNESNYDLKYGVVDVNSLDLYVPEKTVDFIITDPPYGGLVKYLDLSYIWLIWLKNIDSRYAPNFSSEITINKKAKIDINIYVARFTGALKQLYKVLKDEGKIVLTFHNKQIPIWNAFLLSIKKAGFKIEKVIHQQNLRSGESVVGNPYGTSGTDFYIRCVKDFDVKNQNDGVKQVDNSILQAAIRVVAERNEPTPYQILFNGILAYLSMHGQLIEDFDSTISSTLHKFVGNVFSLTDNTKNKAGNLWWFCEPKKYINYPDIPLSERVEQTVVSILRQNGAVTLDEVLKSVFMKFPNGLTPDQYSVQNILKKYAKRSQNKWIFQNEKYENIFTQHTKYLKNLAEIGKRLGYEIFIGKREQPEIIHGKELRSLADYIDLKHLNVIPEILKRIEMIDMIWLKNGEMKYLIEVENSTTITSAIQRASNANNEVDRFIVIPDKRENELLKMRDEFFVNGFKEYNWKYITYSDVDKVSNQTASLDILFKGIK